MLPPAVRGVRLVEDDDRTRLQPVSEPRQDVPGRTVEITVDMNEANRPGTGVAERREGVPEPARMERHIRRQLRWRTRGAVADAPLPRDPCLRKPFPGIEAVPPLQTRKAPVWT